MTLGYGDGTFGPDVPLSKRHAVVFMERFYDRILQADESADFTRGDMTILLKTINDGTATTTTVAPSMAAWASVSGSDQRTGKWEMVYLTTSALSVGGGTALMLVCAEDEPLVVAVKTTAYWLWPDDSGQIGVEYSVDDGPVVAASWVPSITADTTYPQSNEDFLEQIRTATSLRFWVAAADLFVDLDITGAATAEHNCRNNIALP